MTAPSRQVDAPIHNARVIQQLRAAHGSLAGWLDAQLLLDGDGDVAGPQPRDRAGWVTLFRQTFRFTGGEITNEFLMSLGYLPGAHRESCPVYARIAALDPPWRRVRGLD